MSCYVVRESVMHQVTAVVYKMLTSQRIADVPGLDLSCFDVCKAGTLTADGFHDYDIHKLYRLLYITNLKAYNGRYNEDCREFPKFANYSEYCIHDSTETFHSFESYMYQLSEHPVYNTAIWWALSAMLRELAYIIQKGGYRFFV